METIGAGLSASVDPVSAKYYSSPSFNSAVAGSWFVRTMGIASIVCAFVCGIVGGVFGGALQIGLGIYILRSRELTFRKLLGSIMIASGCLYPLVILSILGCIALPFATIAYGMKILNTLSGEGRDSTQWAGAHKRAMTGVVAAGVSLLLYMILVVGFALFFAINRQTASCQCWSLHGLG